MTNDSSSKSGNWRASETSPMTFFLADDEIVFEQPRIILQKIPFDDPSKTPSLTEMSFCERDFVRRIISS